MHQFSNESTHASPISARLVVSPVSGWNLAVKRVVDVSISATVLLATLPLMALIALAIRLESPGPVFFSHARVGRNRRSKDAQLSAERERRKKPSFGSLFQMYKFRTMRRDSPTYAVSPSNTKDPRVTRVGRILRSTSLDELPQFLHVLKGEMSVVGPRPEMPFIVERYEAIHRARLTFKPGITGMWQLHGPRDRAIHDAIEWDLYYMENWSLGLDFRILFKTIAFVFRARNG